MVACLKDMGERRVSIGKDPITNPIVYGDPAFTASAEVHRKHKGALSREEVVDNAKMIRPRSASEDTFKDFTVLFKYFNEKVKHRMLNNGRASYKQEIIMATIFYNLHTCYYGNQASGLYMCVSPSAQDYMHNVNQTPCNLVAIAKF